MACEILALACGCRKRAGKIQSGTTNLQYDFTWSAASWADNVYVPQDNKATLHKLAVVGGSQAVLGHLASDATTGIVGSPEDLDRRREQFGVNAFPEPVLLSFWAIFFESLKELIMIILLIGATVSMTVGGIEDKKHGWADGLAILIAVAIVCSVTAFNDFNKQLEFLKLSKESSAASEFRVIRGGREATVKPTDIVVGDVVKVETGAKLPADGLLLRGNDVKTNESALTGESDEIKKDPIKAPVLLSGTFVTSGTGAYLVTAVGVRSLQGSIMKETASEAQDTPLQVKLGRLASRIGYLGITCAIITIAALMILKGTGGAVDESWGKWAIRAIVLGITIAVVAVPEGLPLAVTISLAYSTGKMLQDKNLVRHLDACETMGNATDICTDKTGTLTENRMTTVQAWLAGTDFTFDSSDKTVRITPPASLPAPLRALLCEHLSLNSTAGVAITRTGQVETREVKGSKTEGAGLLLVCDMEPAAAAATSAAAPVTVPAAGTGKSDAAPTPSLPFDLIRRAFASEGRLIRQTPFSSERKMMSTIVQLPDGRVRMYTTGGSDFVLARCTSVASLTDAGSGGTPDLPGPSDGASSLLVQPLSEAAREALVSVTIHGMASQSLRTLAIAYRDFPSRSATPAHILAAPVAAEEEEAGAAAAPDIEGEMVLYGILGIKDPLRKGVPEAVEAASRAGVRVRMVTGDNKVTAMAIARECGILRNPDDLVMEGPVFRKLTPRQLDLILPRLAVLARSSPQDKMILVRRLNGVLPANEKEWKEDHPDADWATQKDVLLPGYLDEWKVARTVGKGQIYKAVVGVTGDGTNDAPALKASDVGLAMGIAGTDVAKEAADIIITDDNFASIVNSICWGRSVYDNVRSFLQFQLVVNIAAVFITFVTAVMQEDPPLNPVQLLWINLIMDTLGALALATRTPDRATLLAREPFSASASLISIKMWRFILVSAGAAFIVMMCLFELMIDGFGITKDFLRENNRYLTDTGPTDKDVNWYRSTFIFNTFTFMVVFSEFSARSLTDDYKVWRGMLTDKAFIGVIIVSVIAQILIIEFGGTFTKTTGLTPLHWVYCVVIASTGIAVGFLLRFIPAPNRITDTADYFSVAFTKKMAAEAAKSNPAVAMSTAIEVRPPSLRKVTGGESPAALPSPTMPSPIVDTLGDTLLAPPISPSAFTAIAFDHQRDGHAPAAPSPTATPSRPT